MNVCWVALCSLTPTKAEFLCLVLFRWLNTLGMSANQGIDVVIRHSFFDHGYNHLVDQNFNPLPVRL